MLTRALAARDVVAGSYIRGDATVNVGSRAPKARHYRA